jgi:hypothetical protein
MERDVRTTPPLLRWVGLGFLFVLAGYFGLCANATLRKFDTPFGRDHYWAAWMGSWWMFTYRANKNTAIELEAERAGQWETVDAAELFPTRWESGLRFNRPYFRMSGHLTAALAQATCRRLEKAGKPSDAVRVSEVKWAKTLGSAEQPRNRDLSEKVLLELPCSQTVPLPAQGPF